MKLVLFAIVFNLLMVSSEMTLKEAINGTKAPQELIDELVLLKIKHYDLNYNTKYGYIVINRSVQKDVEEMFQMMFDMKFPIEKMNPILKYDWNDNRSMEDNNTSSFNYRFVKNTTRLSNHSFGKALDINPRMNPVFYNDGTMEPSNGKRDTTKAGTFHSEHPIVIEFKKRGWRWGGDWTSLKDYHHFDKLN